MRRLIVAAVVLTACATGALAQAMNPNLKACLEDTNPELRLKGCTLALAAPKLLPVDKRLQAYFNRGLIYVEARWHALTKIRNDQAFTTADLKHA